MGSATIASSKNFQRQREKAIHQAMGRPSTSNMVDTVIANSSVSQNACQSIAMVIRVMLGEFRFRSSAEGETPGGQPARCRCYWDGSVKPYVRNNSADSVVLMYSRNLSASFLCWECESTTTPWARTG